MNTKLQINEDVWIPTICCRCYANCSMRVRRVNGKAVKIEGNPDSTMGAEGGLCGKGTAGLQVLYDPNRLNVPLKRTNPEKGLFVDPKWKEITWEEALDEIATNLGTVLNDDPRKILWIFMALRAQLGSFGIMPFGGLAKENNYFLGGGGLHCGNGAHEVAGMVHGAWSIVPDFRYCEYAIYFGASKGHGSGHSAMIAARQAAEARLRGMKLVVFDPMCNFAGGKATEWVPIIPGTDGAVALAICNIIVNELGTWDEEYLKFKSNGPYLVGADQRYVRDEETNKPLIWDSVNNKAKVYDDPSIKNYSLEGEYRIDGLTCRPSFQLVKEHLKKYTPEMASKVSTVPSKTIRRIAVEFAEAAHVGSTIKIDGKQLPFRPASAVIFRGGEGHENSFHTCFAVSLLNQIVGACDVPGGTLGWPARGLGCPKTGKIQWSPYAGKDGLLETQNFGPTGSARWPPPSPEELSKRQHRPWPIKMPELRQMASLRDIFPVSTCTFVYGANDCEEIWQKIGLPYRFEMCVAHGCNVIMSLANQDSIAKFFSKIPFTVVFELFNTEFTEGFADIVLPDTSYLEESSIWEAEAQNFNYAMGLDDWCFHIIQPVVNPSGARRSYIEVMWELMDRVGRRKALNDFINRFYGFEGFYQFAPEEKFTVEQLADRALTNLFGPEHDWEWFKQHGFIRWPKKVEEAYWRWFVDARTPIYLEFLVDIGKKFGEITKEIDLHVDSSQYTPFISWMPCSIHRMDKEEYDLYCFSYRDILHGGSATMEQPWIDEASHMNPYTYNITMNADTGRKKGLKDGDKIEIETVAGRRASGTVKLMEGQHPLTVAIAACSGHWAKGQPIAKGKGTNFDVLLELDLNHCDPISLNLETCARVKVYKV